MEMRIPLLDALASKNQTFTTAEAYKAWGAGAATKMLLSRLEKAGWIERIEKGKYMIVPIGSGKGKYTLHEFVIASMLVRPAVIAYWSALHHHGLTEQIPRTIFVQTTGRKRCSMKEVIGLPYRIVRVRPYKLFGISRIWLESTEVEITDPEKTIIDCLDRPDLCGGLVEAAKGVVHGTLDMDKLAEYASRIGNTGAGRRLGFLLDRYGKSSAMVKRPEARNYLLLDPSMPPGGKRDGKWRLTVNLGELELGELE
jgi:predicted transcriptional regulator of viral defense system